LGKVGFRVEGDFDITVVTVAFGFDHDRLLLG
jgi:hypothetical protein